MKQSGVILVVMSLIGWGGIVLAVLSATQPGLLGGEPAALSLAMPGMAEPAATAVIVEPTVVVAEPTATPTETPSPTATIEPTAEPTAESTATAAPTATAEPEAETEAAAGASDAAARNVALSACPLTSDRQYTLIPVQSPPTDRPAELHGDLNLALRGYAPTSAALSLIDLSGATDGDTPFFPAIFGDGRTPVFTSAHRVYDWNWACGDQGCPGDLTSAEVSLLGMAGGQGEPISFPSRDAEIYGGGYRVLVLYASEERITLGYARDDTIAPGYSVHLEGICVDPNLLALYRQANQSGRGQLPGLRNNEVLGTVKNNEVMAAIRDRGNFMDPRSRKDWWRGR